MSYTPLPFAPPELTDASSMQKILCGSQTRGNDLSFVNLYLLREKYQTTIAIVNGFLFRHYAGNSRFQGYALPTGNGNIQDALRLIENDAACRERELRFCLLTEEDVAILQQLLPGQFHFTTNNGDADYIYQRTDLANLPGTTYHKKRNHIARFKRLFPNLRFLPLNDQTAHDAQSVADAWLTTQETTPAVLHEHRAIQAAISHFNQLNLCGGILYVGNIPIAMSIASYITPQTADIHYEKCLPEYRGAYPIINQEMAKMLKSDFINREEDLNIPGLRQAKLSYRPAFLLHKYSASRLHTSC